MLNVQRISPKAPARRILSELEKSPGLIYLKKRGIEGHKLWEFIRLVLNKIYRVRSEQFELRKFSMPKYDQLRDVLILSFDAIIAFSKDATFNILCEDIGAEISKVLSETIDACKKSHGHLVAGSKLDHDAKKCFEKHISSKRDRLQVLSEKYTPKKKREIVLIEAGLLSDKYFLTRAPQFLVDLFNCPTVLRLLPGPEFSIGSVQRMFTRFAKANLIPEFRLKPNPGQK